MNTNPRIRPLDYVLAAVMVAIAAVLGVANVVAGAHDSGLAHQLDSHSPMIVPVLVLTALPILWRRQFILQAVGVSFVVMAASVPAFGWITRCGIGLPLSIAMAYAVARFAGDKQRQALGLFGVLALQVVTLVNDSATGGLSALSLGVPVAAAFYGIGVFVQHQAQKKAQKKAHEETPTQTHDGPATPTLGAEQVHA